MAWIMDRARNSSRETGRSGSASVREGMSGLQEILYIQAVCDDIPGRWSLLIIIIMKPTPLERAHGPAFSTTFDSLPDI